jgi:O-antigen ligase
LTSKGVSVGHLTEASVSTRSRSRSNTVVVVKQVLLVAFFVLCVHPLSINGLGANYSFVLLPLVVALGEGRLRGPGEMLTFAMAIFAAIFFVATLYQVDLLSEISRRFISFVIFMSMFAFAFITVDEEKVAAFKTALVLISVYFSFDSAYGLFEASAVRTIGFEAKDLVGTQRFGFVYLLALWAVYLDDQQRKLLGVFRLPVLAILICGLVLTFSRASIASLIGSALLFALVKHGSWLTKMSLRGVLRAVATVIGVAVIIAVLFRMFPIAFEFFGVRLFGFLSNAELVEAALEDEGSSEGTRLYLATRILDFVTRNPFTGSGYLGVWIMPGLPVASAHNQYLDVLFRTGFIGAFLYGCILLAILRHLWRYQEGLFWGFIGVMIYGLFHETFKESQGAFLLAFLVGIVAQSLRDKRRRKHRDLTGALSEVTG